MMHHPKPFADPDSRSLRAAAARRASPRKKQADPTMVDRDYTAAEWEFMQAIQEHKRTTGRQFPTWTEVFGVLIGLGYQRGGQVPEISVVGAQRMGAICDRGVKRDPSGRDRNRRPR